MVVKVHPSFARTDAEIAPFLPKWQLKAEMNEISCWRRTWGRTPYARSSRLTRITKSEVKWSVWCPSWFFLTLDARHDAFLYMPDIRESQIQPLDYNGAREISHGSINRLYERWKRGHFLSSCNWVNERKLIDHLSVVWRMDVWWTRCAERKGERRKNVLFGHLKAGTLRQTDGVMVTSNDWQERKRDVWLDI